MRHSLQVVAAAAVLALLCGCQTMPTMRPSGPPAPMMASADAAPAPVMESRGSSVVADCDCVDGACYGGAGTVYGGQGCQLGRRVGLQARNMHHVFRGPHGPPVTQITYPYYTLRGPRDFLADDPPSLGP
jgi:hypothetical protein